MEFEEKINVGAGNGLNSQVLRNHQLALEDELRNFVLEGDVANIIRVKNELSFYPDLITATEISELKQKIENVAKRLVEIRLETHAVEQIKGKYNKIYAEQVALVEKTMLEINRVESALYVLDSERDSIVTARSEYKKKLRELIQQTAPNMKMETETEEN